MCHRLLQSFILWALLAPVPGITGQRPVQISGTAEFRAAPAIVQPPASTPARISQAAPAASRPPSPVDVGGSIGRPEVRIGDRWQYRVIDKFTSLTHSIQIEVVALTEDRIHTRSMESAFNAASLPVSAGIAGLWDRDWNPLVHGGIVYKPFYPVLQFPLAPGKQWSGIVQWDSGTGILKHQLAAKVEGWERVTVPAGSFDTVRITVRGYISESGSRNYYAQSGSLSSVIWYAPAVGQIIKKEIDHRDDTPIALGRLSERWELVEYLRH